MDITTLKNKENKISSQIDTLDKRANDLVGLHRSGKGNSETLQEADSIDEMREILETKLFDVRWEIMLAK